VIECIGDHVCLLDELPNGMTLAQKIDVTLVFSGTEILAIEDHKIHNTFLRVAFGS
jgi:hypothetical protein